jgi:hypothetical protein
MLITDDIHVSPELEANFWELDVYWDPAEDGAPPLIIPIQEIQCQVVRLRVAHVKPPLWATSTIERVCVFAVIKQLELICLSPAHHLILVLTCNLNTVTIKVVYYQ